MKKLFSFMLTIAIIATIALLPAEGYSELKWRLYDNFNSGNLNRWIVPPETPDGIITIENGEAKFTIVAGAAPADTVYLLGINMQPQQLQKIKGIRATVRVMGDNEKAVGGILGGIGAIVGKLDGFYVRSHFLIQAGYRNIFCILPIFITSTNWFDIFYGEFGDFPDDITGEPFTITMIFSENEMKYEVSGFGTITRNVAGALTPSDTRHFRGLITTNGFGSDTANVYFDDVYILK